MSNPKADRARRLMQRMMRDPRCEDAALPPEGQGPGAGDSSGLAALGFPPCLRARAKRPAALAADPLRPEESPAPHEVFVGREGLCMVSVCTVNHLHCAREMVGSFHAHHPEAAVFLAVADWDGETHLEVAGATLLAGRAIAGWHFDYMALKYTATELCCALKPYAINHALERTRYGKVVYLDADIYVFAPLARMLERLDSCNFVVTPHTLAPLPFPERFWERPSMGELAYAGVLNAGMLGLSATPAAKAFIDVWQTMVTAPGAFLDSLGPQLEQNSFNWITCFADGVEVLRDSAYNVAYWNLHDRSLRCGKLDDGGDDWTVDGKPLVTFHFSGFSPETPHTFSCWDRRHSVYILPSVARLLDFYAARLLEQGAAQIRNLPYAFDALPSGIRIDRRMREIFKTHETFLWSELCPWTEEGEAHYCEALLSPVPYTGSLLPILLHEIYFVRPDLQEAHPEARTRPGTLLTWFTSRGIYEHGYEEIFDRHRPVLPTPHGAFVLGEARRQAPRVFEGLASPLGADRQRLIGRLIDAGLATAAGDVRTGAVERFYFSPIRMIRDIFDERPDVRRAFPDPLFADAPAFTRWLETHAIHDHFLPPQAPAVFAAKAQGRSLARVFSFFNRSWELTKQWPLALVGEASDELAKALLVMLRHSIEHDLDDVEMFLWLMDVKPWAGVPLTIELAYNACRRPSPLLREGQEALFAPVLGKDGRFREALEQYRREHGDRHRLEEEQARHCSCGDRSHGVSVFHVLRRSVAPAMSASGEKHGGNGAGRPVSPFVLRPGVNLFGFHKSPIGLGNLTRGLGRALGEAGVAMQPNVLGNVCLDADLSPADFIRRFDCTLDTNVFVSYPHLPDMLLEMCPEHVVRSRRNIAYLAWEQRDGSHYWPEIYGGFDQIWALSEFAAGALRRFMRRDVVTVPCVLDFAAFPPPVSPSEAGLDGGKFSFLYIFDANSSIERKNPEAAIRAFSQAFRPDDPVRLVLRISNGRSLDHRDRLKRMLGTARRGLDITLVLDDMSHPDLLRLLSAADCYVSLHRAEGFGYTCAEGMAYGKPVIATGYSGNLQFMNESNSYLVRYEEREVERADGPFQRGSIWAEPDVEHAAHLMRTVLREQEAAREVGEQGRRDVRDSLSAEAVGRVVAGALGLEVRRPPQAPAPAPPGWAPASGNLLQPSRAGRSGLIWG